MTKTCPRVPFITEAVSFTGSGFIRGKPRGTWHSRDWTRFYTRGIQ
ncbi:MAG: hypothetical protein H6Q69_254 [Firmicutes bacterium]|nr:hypothetical protein [Bacillota bacterium]